MFDFKVMNQSEALEISETWLYPPPYDFYDMKSDPEDYHEFMDETIRTNYYSVYYHGRLCAFFTFSRSDHAIDIGLGMNPADVSKGMGQKFVSACLDFVNQPHLDHTLSVAAFNERAIKVYERCGFVKTGEFDQQTNGSTFGFIKMVRINTHADH